MIDGWVATEFEPVLDAFTQNFDERGEVGAAVCVYVDGRPVVDLWGGVADTRTGAPWREDTIVLVYSSTKGVTSVCANLMIERGLLDPDATVASVWPEFAANGKEAITVGQVLSHQAGLPYVEGDVHARAVARVGADGARARGAGADLGTRERRTATTCARSAGSSASWCGAPTRSTGRSARSSATRSRTPLGLDFWIGLPESLEAARRARSFRRRRICAKR